MDQCPYDTHGQTLFDLLNGSLRVYTADDLRQVETLRGWRIAKGKPFCCKNQKVRFLTAVTL